MAGVLDPTPSYILLLALMVIGAMGLGYASAGDIGFLGSSVLIGIIGFLGGIKASHETTHIPATAVFVGLPVALIAWLLPITVLWGLAAFLLAFILGMRTERR